MHILETLQASCPAEGRSARADLLLVDGDLLANIKLIQASSALCTRMCHMRTVEASGYGK